MECYSHEGEAAVGICRVCGKGVCRKCAQELSFGGIVCSEACATKATKYEENFWRSDRLLSRNTPVFLVLLLAMCAISAYFGWRGEYGAMIIYIIFALAVAASILIRRQKRPSNAPGTAPKA
jgi:hypothetical protein